MTTDSNETPLPELIIPLVQKPVNHAEVLLTFMCQAASINNTITFSILPDSGETCDSMIIELKENDSTLIHYGINCVPTNRNDLVTLLCQQITKKWLQTGLDTIKKQIESLPKSSESTGKG